MVLAFIGFIVLALLGLGFCAVGVFLLFLLTGGLYYVGRWYPVLPLIQFIIGGLLLWLAFANAPFTITVG